MNAITRLEKVVAARRTDRELIELFGLLRKSEKFTEDEKPACFALLCELVTKRVSHQAVPAVLTAISESDAARRVRSALSSEDADKHLRVVVSRALLAAPREADQLLVVFRQLEKFGVSDDRGHTLSMAIEAQLDAQDLDEICDLTFAGYYPEMARAFAEPATV